MVPAMSKSGKFHSLRATAPAPPPAPTYISFLSVNDRMRSASSRYLSVRFATMRLSSAAASEECVHRAAFRPFPSVHVAGTCSMRPNRTSGVPGDATQLQDRPVGDAGLGQKAQLINQLYQWLVEQGHLQHRPLRMTSKGRNPLTPRVRRGMDIRHMTLAQYRYFRDVGLVGNYRIPRPATCSEVERLILSNRAAADWRCRPGCAPRVVDGAVAGLGSGVAGLARTDAPEGQPPPPARATRQRPADRPRCRVRYTITCSFPLTVRRSRRASHPP